MSDHEANPIEALNLDNDRQDHAYRKRNKAIMAGRLDMRAPAYSASGKNDSLIREFKRRSGWYSEW